MKKTIQIRQGEKGLETPSGFFQALEELGFEKSTDNTELIDVKNEMLAILKRIVDLELSRQGQIKFPVENDAEMSVQFKEFLASYHRDNEPIGTETVKTLERFLSGKIPIDEVSYFHQSEFRNTTEKGKVSRRFSNHREIHYALEALRNISKVENLTKNFQEGSSQGLNEIIYFSIQVGRFQEKALTANLSGLAKIGGQTIQGGKKGNSVTRPNQVKLHQDILDYWNKLPGDLSKGDRNKRTALRFGKSERQIKNIRAAKK
jgi:hypothetical protein